VRIEASDESIKLARTFLEDLDGEGGDGQDMD
jgi:hypothetical protein